ncbi:MAG: rod shape-determining protein RodA [Rhodospirillales bacterium]
MSDRNALNAADMGLWEKFTGLNWFFVLLLTLTAAVGAAMLYSAAHGNIDPWARRHIIRFAVGLVLLIAVAMVDIRFWLKHAYTIYGVAFVMLVAVEVMGTIGMGAQRWIDLGYITLQPSEMMKIALVLALARYFHGVSIEETRRIGVIALPILLIGAPAALVLRQPDLGTAAMLAMGGAIMMFAAGVRVWVFVGAGAVVLAAAPVAWNFLRPYQQNRVLTFLNPETDPLGAGYHIIQSKIALGSGGVFGKGFLEGTQSHLNFLPEMQTDFIFTMLAEEFGLMGGVALLALYTLILASALAFAVVCGNQFGRLVVVGVASTFFLYVFINIAMVMGVIPVVGVPLPLISYGGTAMLTLLVGFGLLLGAHLHRHVYLGRLSTGEDD